MVLMITNVENRRIYNKRRGAEATVKEKRKRLNRIEIKLLINIINHIRVTLFHQPLELGQTNLLS